MQRNEGRDSVEVGGQSDGRLAEAGQYVEPLRRHFDLLGDAAVLARQFLQKLQHTGSDSGFVACRGLDVHQLPGQGKNFHSGALYGISIGFRHSGGRPH